MNIFICQFCGRETESKKGNGYHQRYCNDNPNPKKHKEKSDKWTESMNKRKGKGTNQYTKAKELGLEKPVYDRSNIQLSGCIIASSEQKSIWAKEAKTGGYKENAGRSKKFRVNDSFGKEVVLQSSYELRCSEILNNLKINWIRPKHLKWCDGLKKYFADFYLPDYNIYLDPKNNYKAKLDKEKIESVIKENCVKVYIISEAQLTEEYIRTLVSPNGEGLS
jgi:hypothetical protein